MSGRMAVVVGIDSYGSRHWRRLQCCVNDAESIAEVLELPEYGFEVTLLRDGEATATKIIGALMAARQKQPEMMILYFAGHGASTELDSSIVTYDNEEYREGIELRKLATIMSAHDFQASVTFLDCCHSGGATYRGAGNAESLRAADVQKIYAGMDSSKAILAACGEAELAAEEQSTGHGIFTNYLLEGLYGEAADYEGNVSVHSLYDFISRFFMEREMGQTPVFRGDITGRLILAKGLPPRLGPPMEESVSVSIENEAESYLEQYSRKLAEYPYSEWRTEGYSAACRALTPIDSWFTKQLTKSPALIRRNRFGQLYDSLLSRKITLGAIDPSTVIDEGTLAESIGSGGFGTVWKVHPADGTPDKAYKVYHPHDIRDIEKTSRFRTGYDAMSMLRHNHIVQVHRFTDCPLGFIMDYIPGQNLRDVDPSSTVRDPVLQLSILIQVAETIEHAHNNGVIHRDIKPENIVCTYDSELGWTPYLTDFDLAWFSMQTQRATKSALGVVYYAAPEQHVAFDARKALGKRPTLDVFSFGQLCHFLITGDDPDPVRMQVNVDRMGKRLSQWTTATAVTQFRELYEQTTKWDPDERIQEFSSIISALRNIRDEMTYSSLSRKLDQIGFRNEVAFQVIGHPVSKPQSDSVSFATVSGNWDVILTCRERMLGKREALILEAHFTPNERVGLTNISNERLRQILNGRVDSALSGPVTARRRSGKHGSYEVFVDFEVFDLTLRRVRDVRDMMTAIIGALERD